MKHLMINFLKDLNLESLDSYINDRMNTLLDSSYEFEEFNYRSLEVVTNLNGDIMATKFYNEIEGVYNYTYSEEFKEIALKIITQLVRIRIESWLD